MIDFSVKGLSPLGHILLTIQGIVTLLRIDALRLNYMSQ
jgi:hypothetical protein